MQHDQPAQSIPHDPDQLRVLRWGSTAGFELEVRATGKTREVRAIAATPCVVECPTCHKFNCVDRLKRS